MVLLFPFTKENIIKSIVCLFLLIFLFNQAEALERPSEEISPITEKTLKRFAKLNLELELSLSLSCTYYQDSLLAYLHHADNLAEYEQGMRLIGRNSRFRQVCRYVTEVINFYTGQHETLKPQTETISYYGQEVEAFLNTFKTGRQLTEQEREQYFKEEEARYLTDCQVKPFILDRTSIHNLASETIYNYALLPDGRINVALERPGDREYHVRDDETVIEAFSHPNHTILAGSPHQCVITAGSFIIHRCEDKYLWFITCKSGHFQPTYDSVKHFQLELSKLGVNPYTIISTPDVDMSRVILKNRDLVKVPISMAEQDTQRLYQLAVERWKKVYQDIDQDLLRSIAEGTITTLDAEIIKQLSQQREEATYMRSAFNLFSCNHQSPSKFKSLVKHFGKLKDAIKHQVPDKMQSAALKVIELLDQEEDKFLACDDDSFYLFFIKTIGKMRELLSQEKLLIDDFHLLKKISREIGVLFMYMAEDVKFKGKGYLINRTASDAMFQINEKMGKIHDAYVYKILHEEVARDETVYVELSPKIADELTQYINHFLIVPPRFSIEIDREEAWWLINWAKEWYSSQYYLLKTKYPSNDHHVVQSGVILLEALLEGDLNKIKQHEDVALLHFKTLIRDAEMARNALNLLDATHQVPEIVHAYIKNLKVIVQAIESNSLQNVKEEASYILNFCRSQNVTYALNEWQCTDQTSFDETLTAYLSYLNPILYQVDMTHAEGEKIIEHVQAIEDLMYLYKKNGLSRIKLPIAFYDTIEEHAMALIELMREELKNGSESLTITPQMAFHANFIRRIEPRQP